MIIVLNVVISIFLGETDLILPLFVFSGILYVFMIVTRNKIKKKDKSILYTYAAKIILNILYISLTNLSILFLILRPFLQTTLDSGIFQFINQISILTGVLICFSIIFINDLIQSRKFFEEQFILERKIPFIHSNIFFRAQLDTRSGKQKLIIEKINEKTKKVELKTSIDCIQPVLTDKSIKIDPMEKFEAFNSWITGLSHYGFSSFKILTEIDNNEDVGFSLSSQIIRFMSLVDIEIFYEYLIKIEKECVYEGILHKGSMFASLEPIFASFNRGFYRNNPKTYEMMLKAIISMKFGNIQNLKRKHYFFLNGGDLKYSFKTYVPHDFFKNKSNNNKRKNEKN